MVLSPQTPPHAAAWIVILFLLLHRLYWGSFLSRLFFAPLVGLLVSTRSVLSFTLIKDSAV